jgi:hypothetical protein
MPRVTGRLMKGKGISIRIRPNPLSRSASHNPFDWSTQSESRSSALERPYGRQQYATVGFQIADVAQFDPVLPIFQMSLQQLGRGLKTYVFAGLSGSKARVYA